MPISGKGGKLKIGSTGVTDIKGWKLDVEQDLKEVTDFDSAGKKEYIPTLTGWSGSAEGFWNVATDTAGQKALQDAVLGGTAVTIEFNSNGTNKYTGSTYVKKISIDEPVDDVVKFSVDLQGSGALTYA